MPIICPKSLVTIEVNRMMQVTHDNLKKQGANMKEVKFIAKFIKVLSNAVLDLSEKITDLSHMKFMKTKWLDKMEDKAEEMSE